MFVRALNIGTIECYAFRQTSGVCHDKINHPPLKDNIQVSIFWIWVQLEPGTPRTVFALHDFVAETPFHFPKGAQPHFQAQNT